MTSHEIRKAFLDFFAAKSHQVVSSAPMVIKDDPSLMFTNAGMNQFKAYFLGNATPKNPRVTNTQKCLRVSGKHNDLEEVGRDTYHHTMFEMLGNWSFGDYFKAEAIAWAWELLTEVYQIDKNNLYVTVFEGSDEDGLPLDNEALQLWKSFVPEERILMGNKKDNFWEMGDQGPCGPCSEIHIDLRSDAEKKQIPGSKLVNQDHPLVIEIWNLVFMQFNRKADGSLENLPARHVDTGMGFERLCMVLQNKKSNYDTDVFTPIIKAIEECCQCSYGKKAETDIAIRVIADHLRAVSFAIADGQLPSNTGAGYVIRRILRRAIRYGFTFLNQKEAFIHRLVPVLSKEMQSAFPELKKQAQLIIGVIKEEETSFLRTLAQGLNLLDDLIKNTSNKEISGAKAFELYDTYGFPADLTALILSENGMSFNQQEFDIALQEQKERSRAAAHTEAEDWIVLQKASGNDFIGYENLTATVNIVKYRKTTSKKEGIIYQVVLNQTPFYPEGGGQVGDTGVLIDADNKTYKVINTLRENDQIIHHLPKLPENISQDFEAKVSLNQRKNTALNHTATHLLHEALREVLGKHVEQKGSLVRDANLRFDFSHFSKVSAEELQQVEDLVNQHIEADIPLQEFRNIPIQEALDKGAMALFGEKYGENVRAIQFGSSIELCGGTHAPSTGAIWHFKITGETAVAAGIRRIEAITGEAAKNYFKTQEQIVQSIKNQLNNAPNPLEQIVQLQEQNQALKHEIEGFKLEKIKLLREELKSSFEAVNAMSVLIKRVDLDAASTKNLIYELAENQPNSIIILGGENEGKALLSCYISKQLTENPKLNAGQLVRSLGKYIQGGGGGQAFFATAGGKNPDGINAALEEAKKIISQV